MAVADTVEVVLDADTTKYLSDLNRADKEFARITANMEREALQAGAAFSSLKLPAVNSKPVDRLNQSLDKTNLQVGNLAAQFNDIGVQLAGGQSPFLIALQQGSQINQVLGSGGAGGTVKALGAAFASLISPVSLATIALITLGGVAIQALGSIIPKTETATEAIKRHADALKEIVKGYDNAETALNDYVSATDKLPQAAAQLELEQQIAKGNEELLKFTQYAGDLGRTLSGAGSEFDRTMGKLLTDFAEGRISAGDLATELTRIGNTDLGPLGFLLQGIIDDLTEGALKANAFSQSMIYLSATAAELARNADLQFRLDADVESLTTAIDTIKGLTPELRTQQQIIQDTYSGAIANARTEQAKAELTAARDTALAAQAEVEARKAAEEAANKAAAASRTATAEKDRERQAVLDLIAQIDFETSLIGMSNEQKAVANALRRAGAAATDEERAAIEAKIVAQMRENEELKRAEELYNAIKGAAEGALKGFLHDIAEGKSLGEAFSNTLEDILGKLIDIGVSLALNAIFPGLGTLAGGFGGGRASGGPVKSGTSYVVGERGPEIFTPSSGGNITSNADAMGLTGGGRLEVYLGPGLEASLLDQAANQSVTIVKTLTPPMIDQGAPVASARSQRNRVI